MNAEGYIKYACVRKNELRVKEIDISGIQRIRTTLIDMGLIGVAADGIGFGNISVRANSEAFIITASKTGSIRNLGLDGFVLVERVDITANTVYCSGLNDASSESMTHAAVYLASPGAGCAIHVHSAELWKRGVDKLPKTPDSAEFGTPELAFETGKLAERLGEKGAIAFGGHPDGLLFWGATPESAFEELKRTIGVLLAD